VPETTSTTTLPSSKVIGDRFSPGGTVVVPPPQKGSTVITPPPAKKSTVVAPPPQKSSTVVAPPPRPESGTVFVFPNGIGQHNAAPPPHKTSRVVTPPPQEPANMGGMELLGVIFAAVVCCAGCSVVGCYFCGPPGSAFTNWGGDFARWASGRGPGTTMLLVESNQGFFMGDRLVIKSNVASEVNFVHALEGDDVIILAERLQHEHPPGTVISSKTATTCLPGREGLVAELFHYLDADGNQFLDASELLALAKHNGFRGNFTEWGQTYSRLAKIHFKENEKQGCTLMQFKNLVADRSSDLYVNDEDINMFLDLMGD
jgi:hypothetical protein